MDTKARTISTVAVIVAVVAFIAALGAWVSPTPAAPAFTPQGVTNFDSITLGDDLVTVDDVTVGDDLTVTDDTTLTDDVDINGDLDVDGTLNADAIDIDGAVQLDAALTVGVDGTSHDVIFYSDTAGDYFEWDQSKEVLYITGTNAANAFIIGDGNVSLADDLAVDGTTNLDDVDIDLSAALNIDGHVVNIGGGTPGTATGDNDLYVTGDLEVDSTVVLATGRFPLQYASSGQSAIAVSQDITGTATVAHGMTTVTWAVCSLGEDPTNGGGDSAHVSVAVSGNTVTVKAWQDDFVTAATETDTTVHCLVVGTP